MEKLKELVISFFKNRGAEVIEDREGITIKNIDQEFQEKYGKNTPYKISFKERDKGNQELDPFYQGSLLFNLIMEYLKKNTSTTILKINFEIDPLEKIDNRISLKNCILKDVKKSYENNFFSRFTFNTRIKYLNKNEEEVNEIFIHEGKVIKGDLRDYNISSGELEEIDTKYMEKDYPKAKESIREMIQPSIINIGREVSIKLEKEIERIKQHYIVQKKELNDITEKSKNKLIELEQQEKTPENLERIKRIKNLIENQNILETLKRIESEQEFAINDEKQKHSVNVDTKLINTTVLYYPIYNLNLELVDGRIKKDFQMSYDPLIDEIKNNHCPSCNQEMEKIALCHGGHVSCPDCLFRCVGCGGQFCKSCLNEKCNSCAGPICKSCSVECKKCKKTFCKQHIREDSMSHEPYCSDCMENCSECMNSFAEKDLTESSGKKICFKCLAKNKKDNVLKSVFNNED